MTASIAASYEPASAWRRAAPRVDGGERRAHVHVQRGVGRRAREDAEVAELAEREAVSRASPETKGVWPLPDR